uniref:C2H2-type domain-containing protein n=1 Tax=Panagrolaimus sp. ES5 TaxID=591445 RepID=A0AC34F8G5_9BILA
MGSESLANRATLIMDDFDHLKDFFGSNVARFQSNFEDKFADVIPKALQELHKGPKDVAEADKILLSLKAKHEADQQAGKLKKKSIKSREYRDRISPYSTASSTPALTPPMDSLESNDEVDSRTCFICSRVLASKSSLFRHVRRKHPDAEDYTRAVISTSSKTNLPYNCAICSKGFNDLRLLSQHQKRHQPKSLECPHCNRRYAFKNEMRKHLHRVHKIEYSEIPDDLAEYAQLTEDGEKYKESHAGRPFKTSESPLEEVASDASNINKIEMSSEAKKKDDEYDVAQHEDDEDDDVDDLLLQKLSESNEAKQNKEEIVESKEEDDSEDDVDDLLLQQLNS